MADEHPDESRDPLGAAGAPADLPLTVGTAGHIDHGKTALVTRLTGTNTDRLREERERGISIELGYAELELPDGRRLSVVDVPGHERFVRTMVAGATGIDLFLLVIAADDGVMPQTVEHLAVIELLGVRRGVVALTKADLVDEELLELARDDVERFLAATPFADAPVVTVSARTGRGLDELRAALAAVAGETAGDRREGAARLPVDRVFTLKGIGTIATGTLWRGEIRPGDALLCQPSGERVTVRSVQMHDRDAPAALAGRRVALNLRGADKAGLERGDWLVAPGSLAAEPPPHQVDVLVRLLPGARPVRVGERLRLHHGTGQHLARLSFFDGKELRGGAEAVAVVRLDGGLAAVEPHDRLVLRSLSPVETVGGALVLDVRPHHWHARAAHAAFLAAVASGRAIEACRLAIADRGLAGLAVADLHTADLAPDDVRNALGSLEREGSIERLVSVARGATGSSAGGVADRVPAAGPSVGAPASPADRWFPAGTLARVAGDVLAALERRASERPDRPFVPTAELTAIAPGLPADALAVVLAGLVRDGRAIEREGSFAVAGGAGVLSDADERLAAAAGERLVAARFAPPTLATLDEELGASRRDLQRVLEVLVQRGEAVRVDKDLWFGRAAVDEARERLTAALARSPEITLAQYRDELSAGRKHAQALLELFDREGLTRRRGDVRVLRARP